MRFRILILLTGFSFFLSCDDWSTRQVEDNGFVSGCQQNVTIDSALFQESISTSNVTIRAAEVLENCLHLRFTYGGCYTTEQIELYDMGLVLYSLPPQRNLALWVEFTGQCRGLFHGEVYFDLSPLQSSADSIILNLHGWDKQLTLGN